MRDRFREKALYITIVLAVLSLVMAVLAVKRERIAGEVRSAFAGEYAHVIAIGRQSGQARLLSSEGVQASPAFSVLTRTYRGALSREAPLSIVCALYSRENNALFAVCAKPAKLYRISLATLSIEGSIPLQYEAAALVLTPSQSELYVAYAKENFVQVYDAKTLKLSAKLATPSPVSAMLCDSRGKLLAALSSEGYIIIDPYAKRIEEYIDTPNIGAMALCADSVWLTHPLDAQISVLGSTSAVEFVFRTPQGIFDICPCGDGVCAVSLDTNMLYKYAQRPSGIELVASAEVSPRAVLTPCGGGVCALTDMRLTFFDGALAPVQSTETNEPLLLLPLT